MTAPAPAHVDTGVEASGLTVRYRRRTALDGVDLALGPGVHGLLGPNGAGKTTLIRCLATVLDPDGGRLRVAGLDPADRRQVRLVRREIGYLPQQFGFHPRFTVREFVEYFAWLKEVPAQAVPLAVDRAIERVDLGSRAGEQLRRLSGGMLRRVGIAQAIVNDPRVLLLDEPTVGLDPEQRLAFRELLRTTGLDACVVVSTHLVEDVAVACDDVVLLDEGRVAFSGTAADLVARGEAEPESPGDSAVERGYTAALRAARGRS